MTMTEPSAGEVRDEQDGARVLRMVGWLGIVFLGIWTLWCASYHACSVITTGEVVAVRRVIERGHRGRPYTATYIKVSYRDQAGVPQQIEATTWQAQPGDARIIRYPSFQPANGRIDKGAWAIWKPCVFAWLIFGCIFGTATYVHFSIRELEVGTAARSRETAR